jgi:putative MFS transporter
MLVADRLERKHQICLAATSIAVFGLLFSATFVPALLIVLGVMVTLSNNWMSFAFHNYQAELFPTRIRARAVGFVYSWSRLSAAMAGLVIDYLLHVRGVDAVFLFIGFAMAMVVISIGVFGPRTRNLSLEVIGH